MKIINTISKDIERYLKFVQNAKLDDQYLTTYLLLLNVHSVEIWLAVSNDHNQRNFPTKHQNKCNELGKQVLFQRSSLSKASDKKLIYFQACC